jgi:hypothetical protein
MKTFQEFISILTEIKGDFGADVKMSDQPVQCYGQTVKYAMAPGKKVCKMKRKRE